ncbi:hypothetical protein E1A91_D01G136900v1 [Gossypium mustelinum]|uniref:Uncharacterized protein n=1 Tax=Gossypium mustelinum TaxID=34275 RepID=A0A5D2W6X0_GOSMU|nr:hypothetical protein E1A91_D01G136900v1 [Gossypium mustelinum]
MFPLRKTSYTFYFCKTFSIHFLGSASHFLLISFPPSILIQTHFPKSTGHCCCLSSLRSSPSMPRRSPDGCSSKSHTMLLVETYHQHRRLMALIEKPENEGSCPMQILGDDGDWTKNDFWAAVKFFKHAFRSNEILQVASSASASVSSCFFNLMVENKDA